MTFKNTFFFLLLASFLVTTLAQETVVFEFVYDGATFGNNAKATGTVTFDVSRLPTGEFFFFGSNGPLVDVTLTVTGSTRGDGTFTTSQLSSSPRYVFTSNIGLDFTRELVGQTNGTYTFDGRDGRNDFNFFFSPANSPTAATPFVLGAFRAMDERLLLVSLRPAGSTPGALTTGSTTGFDVTTGSTTGVDVTTMQVTTSSRMLLVFEFTFDGATFNNNARATGTVTFDASLLPTGEFYFVGSDGPLVDVTLTVTGSSRGDGTFTTSQLSSTRFVFASPIGLDFTRELVGQTNGTYTFGDRDSRSDFNFFFSPANAPTGQSYFTLAAFQRQDEQMLLVSLRPAGSTTGGSLTTGSTTGIDVTTMRDTTGSTTGIDVTTGSTTGIDVTTGSTTGVAVTTMQATTAPLTTGRVMTTASPTTGRAMTTASLTTGRVMTTGGVTTSRAATTPRCGNGVVEAGEECDGGSCCSSACRFLTTPACFCSRQTLRPNQINYFCGNSTAFYQCFPNGNAIMMCPGGTVCGCPSGVECSCNGSRSPCVRAGTVQRC